MVALAAAIAIGFILWIQVDEYGLGDTPWLMGVLAIAALLLVSLRTPKAGAPANDASKQARETLVLAELEEAEEEDFQPFADRRQIILPLQR